MIRAIASRLIGALMLLYPSAFREEFGAAVRDLVERDLTAGAARGRPALLRAAASHAWDIVVSAVGQRLGAVFTARRGTMTNGGDGVVEAWSAWRRDAKYGARLLAKHRAFSAVVVITLALAIGANTVIFTFANVAVLRPLPLRNPETLGWIFNIGPQGDNRASSSVADFYDFRASARSFTSLGAVRSSTATFSGRGDAERLNANDVTANLFDVWGIDHLAGRSFQRGDDAPGAAPVVMLSHQFWQRRFGGDRGIVGQPLTLDGVSHTVIGIVDPAIEIGSLSGIDIWLPLTLDPSGGLRDDRRLRITGRLAAGVTTEQANAEIHAIAKRMQQEHPQTNNGWDAHVLSTRRASVGGNVWLVLSLLGLVVGFVLLIACANLANLLLSRSSARAREIAIRTALGAGRRAIVRQLLIESVLLGAAGGALGLLLAQAGLVAIKSASYEEFFAMLSIDRSVLLFVTAVTFVATVAFSLVPAIQLSRTDVNELLKSATGKASGDARVRRGRAALVVSQVALALSLTVVAILIVRSLVATARIDIGVDPHDAFVFRVDVPGARYPDPARLPLLYDKIVAEMRALPGVSEAGLTSRLPVIGGESPGPMTVEGRVVTKPADQPWASSSAVSAEFFGAARIALLAGHAFSRTDIAAAPRVAIVNREMAKRYWGAPAAAVGKRVSAAGGTTAFMTIVGVVADTRQSDPTLPPNPQLYVPIAQHPERTIALFLRAERAHALLPDVRAAMRRIDDGLALYDTRTFEEALDNESSSDHVLTGLYIAFAVIALSLAAAGLYGVISYSVSQRTRELGIRVALGATAKEVSTLVFAQGARLLVVGVAIGIVGGALIASAIRTLLYGVSPLDPLTYALVIVLFIVVMGIATYLPARRAVAVDPITALRSE